MGITSLQVCMDSSDWLQGTIHEGTGMDSSSSPSEDILTCTRPLIERRLKPPHDQALNCPRCDSTNTKFCYYNNYSLTQPRYFCKSCRRYWTKGGTLRNIPVGGGCRKNKKVSSKKSNDHQQQSINQNVGSSSSTNPTDLQLSYPDMQFSHLTDFLGNHGGSQERIYSDDRVFLQTKVSGSVSGDFSGPNFTDTKYNIMLENQTPIDFMQSKYEALVGNGELSMMGGLSDMNIQGLTTNFPGICSPFGMALDVNNGIHMDTYHHQRLMLPYESQDDPNALDVKPNTKALSLDWHDHQACSDAGKDTFGYLGSWTGLMTGYGSSATNPLV